MVSDFINELYTSSKNLHSVANKPGILIKVLFLFFKYFDSLLEFCDEAVAIAFRFVLELAAFDVSG